MKLSFFNSLPDDIPTVLGQRVTDEPAKVETLGDQAYNFMAGVASDMARIVSVDCPGGNVTEAKPVTPTASSGSIQSIDDIMRVMSGEIKREDVRECLIAVKDAQGASTAREILLAHGGVQKFSALEEDKLRQVMQACLKQLYVRI